MLFLCFGVILMFWVLLLCFGCCYAVVGVVSMFCVLFPYFESCLQKAGWTVFARAGSRKLFAEAASSKYDHPSYIAHPEEDLHVFYVRCEM